jgi:hypothetical protein
MKQHTMAEQAAWTKTAIALLLLGGLGTAATWFAGYQGNLERMLLELVLAPMLGVVSAAAFQSVHYRLRSSAAGLVWCTLIGASLITCANQNIPAAGMQLVKVMVGSALYGALLSTILTAAFSFLVVRFGPQTLRE